MTLQRRKIPFISVIPDERGAKLFLSSYDHIDAFQSLVKYLAKLRRDGDIDNETFGELVRQTAATFVETEISERIDNVLEDKISFDRLLELL